ncbi:MAG TPA: sugar ABC transporter ATP-binding protein [Ilumatobacteraceae bacterium]|nr:sugar ABC transporter ATP-binding protein [Ilumatobacteraceae bacterium]HRB01962.1 sugar ABC transporter ATP-binding protein [Ilumatobacteraceae bacterium]
MKHPEQHVALSVRQLRKVYGGTVALADVDVDVYSGEIHALLGENGAGKSTLVRLLAGVEPADGGSLSIYGDELPARFSPEAVTQRGVVFIHQNLGLVEDLSVAENIALLTGFARRGPFISWAATRKRAAKALRTMGVDIDVRTNVGDLPMSSRAIVAIARALVQNVKLLVLDEPTATLGAHEVETLFAILRRLRDQGVAIILITHRLEEVLAICDRITVLRDGRVTGVCGAHEVSEHDLVRMIVGTDLPGRPERNMNVGEAVVSFDELRAGGAGPLTFEVRRGEVLGVTGLSGAGHSVLPRVLFGLEPIRSGTITLDGTPFAPRTPADATERGCSLVPADRNGAGAVTTMDLRENLFMNPRQSLLRRIVKSTETRSSLDLLKKFDVRPPLPAADFSTLSGGNAQKVVLARCLSSSPILLVLEEPTAAVDIGARAEIHRRIRVIAENGAAVLVVSSDLEEIEVVCDRAIVMERGRVRGSLEGSAVTAAALLEAAYGVYSYE